MEALKKQYTDVGDRLEQEQGIVLQLRCVRLAGLLAVAIGWLAGWLVGWLRRFEVE